MHTVDGIVMHIVCILAPVLLLMDYTITCLGEPNSSNSWKPVLAEGSFIHQLLSISDLECLIKAAQILIQIVSDGVLCAI